jgi:two-component system, LuxR family, response regulator FixJ
MRGDFASFWRRHVDEDQNVPAKRLDKLKPGNPIRHCNRIKKADFLATSPAVSGIEPNQRDRANPPQLFSKYDRIRDSKTLIDMMAQGSRIALQGPVVAIVDDDSAVCSSLKFSLELEGFTICTYGSGAELLDADDLDGFNCFVIDQRMPAMNGMELIAILRERKVMTPAILIISQPNATLRARAGLADIWIVEKPLLGNALVDRIREACRPD